MQRQGLADSPDRRAGLDALKRLFGFDYRFEAFVPAAKRVYGYYVLPLLEGDRIIGRVDLKTDRQAGVLRVKGLWWEDGIKATRRRRTLLDAALASMADFVGRQSKVKRQNWVRVETPTRHPAAEASCQCPPRSGPSAA